MDQLGPSRRDVVAVDLTRPPAMSQRSVRDVAEDDLYCFGSIWLCWPMCDFRFSPQASIFPADVGLLRRRRRIGSHEVCAQKETAYQVRTRAIAPAMICMVRPNTHPSIVIIVQTMCGFSRSKITPTDTKAVNEARNVPTALRNSAVSIFRPEPPFEGPAFGPCKARGGVSIPK